MIKSINELNLAIIGLGYVGLPLALEFAKKKTVIGFDLEKKRINQLKSKIDKNLEINQNEFKKAKKIKFTYNKKDLKSSNCFIVTVPTPIDKFKRPDLKPLIKASQIVGGFLKKNDIVIYESTVYPGCIEEKCVPVLEKLSKLEFNKNFFCGYSPERINPGDKKLKISNIKKVTSGSTPEIAKLIDDLYRQIIKAGTHRAPSIKVAESAKVIENTQRDLNIALVNEFSILFNKLNIDTQDVLNAAASKWNFLPFRPGLVGGHCIGVDPYYLTYKAKSIGYDPKVILAGRNINDTMGAYVANQLINKMKKKGIKVENSKILIMGLTFKENCTDIRNSGIQNVINRLKKFKCKLDLYDPWADKFEIKKVYNDYPISKPTQKKYDSVVISVAHEKFKDLGIKTIKRFCKKNYIIYDLKSLFSKDDDIIRL
jgi:UDP-N-acetyl-D-galactosamine dehydrogenase